MKYALPALLFVVVSISSCKKKPQLTADDQQKDFRQEMRNLVEAISAYAESLHPFVFIVPQNGEALSSDDGTASGNINADYLSAIDGQGREDLYYGYNGDDVATDPGISQGFIDLLDIQKSNGKTILVTDYCSTQSKIDESYSKNDAKGYISFAAGHRALDNIPSYPVAPYHENNQIITQLSQVQNFLYLINPGQFSSKAAFIQAVKSSNYDLLICDLFFDNTMLTANDLFELKHKANGGQRLVFCYMSIGEAENYRYYWQNDWNKKKTRPDWLFPENPDWPGNYKVKYWDPAWQDILFGNDSSYTKKIMDAGFDGIYLDIIDAFEYFESL